MISDEVSLMSQRGLPQNHQIILNYLPKAITYSQREIRFKEKE